VVGMKVFLILLRILELVLRGSLIFVDGLEGKDSCCVENLDPVENLEGGEGCWEENLEFVDDREGELAPVEDLIGEEA